jgi:membrane fusion protein, copper/silver efflux system
MATGWVWKHAAAGIAVVLIVLALIIGYRIGLPAPEPVSEMEAEAHAHDSDMGQPQMYTCSMHPLVRLPDSKAKCPICYMDLILVADEGGEENELRVSMNEEAAALSRIETAPVERFSPTVEIRLFGQVSYDESSFARLTAYFPRRIERLFVNYVGASVSAGDHMAELYSPELLAAFEELRQVADAVSSSSGSELVLFVTREKLMAAREKLRLFGLTNEQIDMVEEGPETLGDILVPTPMDAQVPLRELATLEYRRGPQMIKSEDTFLVAYVLFDKMPGEAEVSVVRDA